MPYYDNYGWGKREDGTYKGPGFSTMVVPDYYGRPSVVTEYAFGESRRGGLFPLVYQGIPPWDMQTLANDIAFRDSDPLFPEVLQSAYLQAIVRAGQGLPAFWQPSDGDPAVLYTRRLR